MSTPRNKNGDAKGTNSVQSLALTLPAKTAARNTRNGRIGNEDIELDRFEDAPIIEAVRITHKIPLSIAVDNAAATGERSYSQ